MDSLKPFIALCLLLFSSILVAARPLPEVVFKAVEISDESEHVISSLIKEGAGLIQTDPVQSRELFVEALQKVAKGVEIDTYNYLWTQYGLLKSSFMPGSAEFGPGSREDYIKVAIQVLDFLDDYLEESTTGFWYYTELGQFQMEVYRTASNGLAWQRLKSGSRRTDWEEALDIIEKTEAYIRAIEDYYILDTKVRILLKLKRKEEAYKIVRRVLAEDENFADFQDLKDSAG